MCHKQGFVLKSTFNDDNDDGSLWQVHNLLFYWYLPYTGFTKWPDILIVILINTPPSIQMNLSPQSIGIAYRFLYKWSLYNLVPAMSVSEKFVIARAIWPNFFLCKCTPNWSKARCSWASHITLWTFGQNAVLLHLYCVFNTILLMI